MSHVWIKYHSFTHEFLFLPQKINSATQVKPTHVLNSSWSGGWKLQAQDQSKIDLSFWNPSLASTGETRRGVSLLRPWVKTGISSAWEPWRLQPCAKTYPVSVRHISGEHIQLENWRKREGKDLMEMEKNEDQRPNNFCTDTHCSRLEMIMLRLFLNKLLTNIYNIDLWQYLSSSFSPYYSGQHICRMRFPLFLMYREHSHSSV